MICPNCGSKMFESFRTWKCSKDCSKKKISKVHKEVTDWILRNNGVCDTSKAIPGILIDINPNYVALQYLYKTGDFVTILGDIWYPSIFQKDIPFGKVIEIKIDSKGAGWLVVELLPKKD